jgi:hypothetical protein
MLERDKGPAKPYAFLIAIDLQEGVDIEAVKFMLADAAIWMEGTGKCEVESLGPIDVYDAPEETI